MHESVTQMRSVQSQLKYYITAFEQKESYGELIEKAKAIEEKLLAWEANLIQSNQKTFQDVINFNNKLNAELMYLKGFVDSEHPKVTQGSLDRFSDLKTQWENHEKELSAIIETEFSSFETLYESMKVPALLIPEAGF